MARIDLNCDMGESFGIYRIGADGDFRIGLNEVAIGLMLPRFGTRLAQDRLSKRHLQRAVCLATIYDPRSAIDVGFLDEVVAPAEVIGKSVEAAAAYAKLSPTAYDLTQANLRKQLVDEVLATIDADLQGLSLPS